MFILQKIKSYIYKTISMCINIDNNIFVFIPHGGCLFDKYNLINYKSDNTLSFLKYIIDNNSVNTNNNVIKDEKIVNGKKYMTRFYSSSKELTPSQYGGYLDKKRTTRRNK